MATPAEELAIGNIQEIGLILLEDADSIVDAWAKTIRTEHRDARESHWKTLRDQFPAYLRSLGSHLSELLSNGLGALDSSITRPGGDSYPSDESANAGHSADDIAVSDLVESWTSAKAAGHETIRSRVLAIEHGSLRFRTDWTLAEVVTDYQTLRHAVFHHLGNRLTRPITIAETQAVNFAMDDAISSAIVSFNQHQQTITELANQRLVDFMGVLGHELRNPLSAVSMAEQLLRRNTDAATILHAGKVVRNNVSLMSRLVDDMLSISRITSGKVELLRSPIDIREVLNRVLVMMIIAAEEKEHRIVTDFPDHAVTVLGDADRLEQVFANLLTNAIRYTQPGGIINVSIRVDALSQPRIGTQQVQVKIADNGIGIAKNELSRIFDLFQQAGDTQNEGLGIGLALVRVLVESHGGVVSVYSHGLGRGTEFLVSLPRVSDASGNEDSGNEDSDYEDSDYELSEYLPDLQPMSFLVVDDRESLADTTASLLRHCGHTAQVAYGGKEAIAIAKDEKFDVVLIDLIMPDLDGYQTLMGMGELVDTQPTWMIAASPILPDGLIASTVSDGDPDDGHLVGSEIRFDGYVNQPVEIRQLIHCLDRLIHNRQANGNLSAISKPVDECIVDKDNDLPNSSENNIR